MLSEYRQRFESFHAELLRDQLRQQTGAQSGSDAVHIWGEYSDLFTPSAIAELRAALDAVSAARVTEREAIKRLIAFAVDARLHAQAGEIAEEIKRYESVAQIAWQGNHVALEQVDDLLATEEDPWQRRELHSRRSDVLGNGLDLRVEWFKQLRAGAVAAGFENLAALRRELCGIDLEATARAAERLLAQTERHYVAVFAPLVAQCAGVNLDSATPADLPQVRRFTRFDPLFPRTRLINFYRDLCSNLGFSTYQQRNVELLAATHAGCFAPQVPAEIKLILAASDGWLSYAESLNAAGRAQHLAWTSASLPPEFRVPVLGADASVNLAWGLLFAGLLRDAGLLSSEFHFTESGEFRQRLAVLRLLAVREAAAQHLSELDLQASGAGEEAAARYVERMTDAVRVQCDLTDYLRAPRLGSFAAADFLRASALEAQLRDHLKTRFGSRWWATRKAGEMLIDLWNTGQRHSAESLAALVGLGELDFAWLAEEMLGQI